MFRAGVIDRAARVLACASLVFWAACADSSPTKPGDRTSGNAGDLLFASKPKLLECETAEFASETKTIGPLGGLLTVGGASVEFPAGALLNETNVTLTIPASRYVEVEITTDGQREFLDPATQPTVAISYERCNRNDLLLKALSAWYIDSETKELEQKMPSFDNKLTSSVSFPASHFSGYAIAF